MIMRVTWGKIRPGKWDEYERLWKEHAKDTSSTPGLRGRWLLRDTETTDAGYSISLWEAAADFDTYAAGAAHLNVPQMNECFIGQYVTTACEVRGTEPITA